jgi:hypothetical protein
MKPLLDFDDAGATDDHPAKGVTVGDIRAWYDEFERLRGENRTLFEEHRIAMSLLRENTNTLNDVAAERDDLRRQLS